MIMHWKMFYFVQLVTLLKTLSVQWTSVFVQLLYKVEKAKWWDSRRAYNYQEEQSYMQ